MTKAVNPREVVLDILSEVLENNKYSHIVLKHTLDRYRELDKIDRSLITRMSEGTIENLIRLDYIINSFSKIEVKKMKPLIRNLLRISVYQLLYMDSIPDFAVCNEAVKIAERRGFVNLKGFVNGVLRAACAGRHKIHYPDVKENPVKSYSVQYSVPEWIVKMWLKDYGQEKLEKILRGLAPRKELWVRCNLHKASKEEIIQSLLGQGITVEAGSIEEALLISNFDSLDGIHAHQAGLIAVQDLSSMLVGRIASPEKNDVVIDVCAAPGGKSLHIAELLDGSGHVEARDLTDYKIHLLKENIDRMGLENIQAVIRDATAFDKASEETADILIADLPCSGLGVMNKKTDLKFKSSEESIKQLVLLQREILRTVQAYVKPGGILIYSTCTVNRKENWENAKWFADNYPFESENINSYIPKQFWSETSGRGMLELIPGEFNTDGFFIARFRRSQNG